MNQNEPLETTGTTALPSPAAHTATRRVSPRYERLTPATEGAARRVINDGLARRWGRLREELNPDVANLLGHYGVLGRELWVLIADDEVIATGALSPEGPGTARISRMSVAAAHEGRGHGRAMLTHLLERAARVGVTRVVLETNDDWDSANHLYRTQGFVCVRHEDGLNHYERRLA